MRQSRRAIQLRILYVTERLVPMNKVGLIINPHARGVRKMNIDPLEYFTGISGGYADIRLTNSLAEVDSVIKDFKKMGLPYVAVCGGDGTSHNVL